MTPPYCRILVILGEGVERPLQKSLLELVAIYIVVLLWKLKAFFKNFGNNRQDKTRYQLFLRH